MPTPESTPAADAGDAASRPSRQSLVVPPRQSNMSAVIGACVCAAAGFGLVWALGIGRGTRPTSDEGASAALAPDDGMQATADHPRMLDHTSGATHREPDLLPPIDDAVPAASATRPDRWGSRPAAHETDTGATGSRYPVKPASLDMPDTVLPAAADAAAVPRFSRFTPADLEPGSDGVVPATREDPLDPAATSTDAAPTSPRVEPSPASAETPEHEARRPTPQEEPGVSHQPGQSPANPLPEDAGDLAAPEPVPVPVPDAVPSEPPAAVAFGAAPPAFPGAPPAPPVPAAQPSMFVPPPATMPATSRTPSSPPTSPPAAKDLRAAGSSDASSFPVPVAAPSSSAADASPFAAAPPVMSDGLAAADPERPAGPPPRQPPVAGVGRPGPMQLEGIQTPQVSVEKRGPREVSVGKPARYEIVVRNVGSATAHDVILRDAVPQGTALVATTPPASPVPQTPEAADGGLAWLLGTLPPGGQTVVTMEVMPQVEGEIGSVASVSFRTDASIRSKATKPDLAIECASPEPVLIGRDLQVTITITNPGTGVATGVVLEGFLPENVSHRSGRELEFDVGQLRPGESRTIDLVLGTRGPGLHAARLAARADGGVEVVRQVPIQVTAPTLEIAIDMPLRRFLQRPATCTIAMTNAGTAPARALELAAQLPPGMKFVKANNAGWHDDRTHKVLWNLEELPAGETGTVQVVVMPVELGPQRIMAAARSADGLSAQTAHACDVEGLAAVSFEVLDSEDPIEVGGVTEYVVRVVNQGTKPATGVRLAATLLGDIEPLEAHGPGGHRVDRATVAFEPLAKLAPAEEAVFRIRAAGRAAGDQRIQVQLTSADQSSPITKEETTRVYADR
ncbi:MAG: CARDB domain-containing protein [Planctomycetaceae bacterium]